MAAFRNAPGGNGEGNILTYGNLSVPNTSKALLKDSPRVLYDNVMDLDW